MGFIYYGEEIRIVSSTKPIRLDIGTAAMKKVTSGSHSSWATKLIIKRLDGPNEGKVEDTHEVGIFSENDTARLDALDIGTGSMKKSVPSSHVSWSTKLKLTFIKDVKDEDFPIINVGNSNVNPKVVQLPEPNMSVYPVPHNDQEPGWRDTFRVDVDGTTLTVTRTDENSGWGQKLQLKAQPNKKAVKYGDTVGVFSSTSDSRLDIGGGRFYKASSSHIKWARSTFSATHLHIQKLPTQAIMKERFKNEWPSTTIKNQVYADRNYAYLPTSVAKDIWQKSGLRNYKWTAETFDCDDFSYVYKGAVSKHVYDNKVGSPYALGIVFGKKPGAGHAVNIFLDENGDVKILEPQNGTVIDGKDWDYTPTFVLM